MGNSSSHPQEQNKKETTNKEDEEKQPENIQLPNIDNFPYFDDHEEELAQISLLLPDDSHRDHWKLLYDSRKNGASFITFRRLIENQGPTIMLIRVSDIYLGFFTNEPWRDKFPQFYGTKSSFIFRLGKDFKIWKSQKNETLTQYLNINEHRYGVKVWDGVAMGGDLESGKFAIAFDSDFDKGYTYSTKTFDNEPLLEKNEFLVSQVLVYQTKRIRTLSAEDKKFYNDKQTLTDAFTDKKIYSFIRVQEFQNFGPEEEDTRGKKNVYKFQETEPVKKLDE